MSKNVKIIQSQILTDFDSNSFSDSSPDYDPISVSINLVIFIFFDMYLHSSK